MEQTTPDVVQSSLYSKRKKDDGERIRAAALNDLSETDDSSDCDRVLTNSDLIYGDSMSLEEERIMDEELIREHENALSIVIEVDDDGNIIQLSEESSIDSQVMREAQPPNTKSLQHKPTTSRQNSKENVPLPV